MRSETSTLLMSVWKLSSPGPFGPRDGGINPNAFALRYLQSRAAPPTSPAPAQTQFVFRSYGRSWCLSLRNKKIFTCFSAHHVLSVLQYFSFFFRGLSACSFQKNKKAENEKFRFRQKHKIEKFRFRNCRFQRFPRDKEEHTEWTRRSGCSEVRRAGSNRVGKDFPRCSSQRIHARRCGLVSNLQLTCPGSEVAWARKGKH